MITSFEFFVCACYVICNIESVYYINQNPEQMMPFIVTFYY